MLVLDKYTQAFVHSYCERNICHRPKTKCSIWLILAILLLLLVLFYEPAPAPGPSPA